MIAIVVRLGRNSQRQFLQDAFFRLTHLPQERHRHRVARLRRVAEIVECSLWEEEYHDEIQNWKIWNWNSSTYLNRSDKSNSEFFENQKNAEIFRNLEFLKIKKMLKFFTS